MDIIYIRDLRIDTYVGIYDWEQEVRQTLSLDLDLATDVAATAASGDLGASVDYGALSERLTDFIGNNRHRLLETLAEQVCELVMTEFGVPWLRLRLGKPGAVPAAADVGVIVERGQRG